MKNKIYIQLGYYFPFSMLLMAALACLAGIALLLPQPIYAIPLLLVGAFILTARYRLKINLTNQTYHDHLWIGGFMKGKKGTFKSIECLFLNKRNYRQQINSRISTMTNHGTEYNGYIRFDTEDVHLLSNDSKAKVVGKLKKISNMLHGNILKSTQVTINATIMDYSEKTAEVIEYHFCFSAYAIGGTALAAPNAHPHLKCGCNFQCICNAHTE
jgi:hypothetical protein